MKNNVHATLSTVVSSVATTIQLTAWQGSRFWTTFPQIATIESFDENWKVIKREIVKITARNGDNLTVVRAFAPCPENDDANSQSQTAISFNADDQISLYIPKEIFDKIQDSFNDIYDNWTNNMRTDFVSWLQVEVNPWLVLVWSAYYEFAGWTITLTDNATNYLEIDEDWNLANNTTGRNDENTKLAMITTSGGSVTNIKDRRLWTVWWKIGGVNIHDLTGKQNLDPDDEFVVADSENIRQNKKIKYSNIIWFWNKSEFDSLIELNKNTLYAVKNKWLVMCPDNESMQWPCANWFHIPTLNELTALKDNMTALWIDTTTWNCFEIYMKMPIAWFRQQGTQWTVTAWRWAYWTTTPSWTNAAYFLFFNWSMASLSDNRRRSEWMSIRPFRNTSVVPTNSWTVLFDGSGIAPNAWIFYNSTDEIISISSDWINRITISDKNLWATSVYNNGDTLSETNCWKFYQWWNNYWFPRTWAITTSATLVDASNYWPWKYYNSSTFIYWRSWRDNSNNTNLWGAIYTPLWSYI